MKRLKWFAPLFIIACFWAYMSYGWNPMIVGGGVPAAGCSASYFEDSFTRGDSGTIDDQWDSETDTGSLLAISSNQMVYTQSATTVAKVTENTGTPRTESYFQFTLKWSDCTMGGNGGYIQPIQFRDATDNASVWLELFNDSGGEVTYVYVRYRDNSTSTQTVGYYDFSPSDGNTYTFKGYMKAESVEDAGDGVITLWINGTQRITGSDLVFTTYADVQRIQFGVLYNSTTDTNSHTITFDDLEWRSDDCFS